VISPEGCASILWRGADRAPDAAEAMKMTATDLLHLGVIHRIVYEPTGGAHRNHAEAIKRLATALRSELEDLTCMTPEELRTERWNFFMQLGAL
jgi:acetyl-CoA carboxylase carboxyl transferase subunit alpha